MVPADNSVALIPTKAFMPLARAGSVERGAPGYPAGLGTLPDAPGELWFKGCLPRPDQPAIAIVGSRSASGAGCALASEMAAAASRRQWAVISGGAFGIDAAAHQGALRSGGETFAVLGCGVDVVYPDRHEALFAQIAAQGGLLSELPLGTPPARWHFPKRNRLIVALAQVVLVVEAAVRSGALITAELARKQGRRLLVVPGSAGTDRLLAAGGAEPVRSAAALDDLLAGRAAPIVAAPSSLSELLAALEAASDTPGGLARRLGLPLSSVMGLLLEAELDGWVRRAEGSHYEVLRGH